MYARSSDGGITWTTAAKDRTMTLPLNTSAGDKSIETLDMAPIGEFHRLGEPTGILIDKLGRPAVFVRPIGGPEGIKAYEELTLNRGYTDAEARAYMVSTAAEPQWYYYFTGTEWIRDQIQKSGYYIPIYGMTMANGVITYVSVPGEVFQAVDSNDLNNYARELKIPGANAPGLIMSEWYNPVNANRFVSTYRNKYHKIDANGDKVQDTRHPVDANGNHVNGRGEIQYVFSSDIIFYEWEFK